MKSIEQKVLKFIDENKLIESDDFLMVALSGGPDSVFCLHFLKKYQRRLKINFAAVHINHQLRKKDSDRDELFCKNLCDDLQIKFHSFKVDALSYALKHKLSVEEASRLLRYKKFDEVSRKFNCNKIVTAHNLNDNAETVLLNLIKGTGLTGISGIPIKRDNIIRPLLSVTKSDILDYLKNSGIKFRVDKTNLKTDFERNFIRKKIIPVIKKRLNPSFEETLFNSTQNFKSAVKLIDKSIDELVSEYIVGKENKIRLKLKGLNVTDIDFLGDILKRSFDKFLEYNFTREDLKKIKSLIENQPGKTVLLKKNFLATRERNEIIIQKKRKSPPLKPKNLIIGKKIEYAGVTIGAEEIKTNLRGIDKKSSKKEEIISLDNINGGLRIRIWKNGDKFRPLGMKGFKKISDFLTEQKIPSNVKKSQLIVENRNNIIWVVGLRLDDRYKINSNTKRALKLWMK